MSRSDGDYSALFKSQMSTPLLLTTSNGWQQMKKLQAFGSKRKTFNISKAL